MKILLYSDHFQPRVGGSENYAKDLAIKLSEYGHTILLVTATQKDDLEVLSFEVHRIRRPFVVLDTNVNFCQFPHIVKNYNPDIFHINYQTGGEVIPLLIAWFLRIPTILTYHADHVTRFGRILDMLQQKIFFRFCSIILTQSDRDFNNLRANIGGKAKLKKINFTGIDIEKYKNPKSISLDKLKGTLKGVSVATLDGSHKYKGIFNLLEMLSKLKEMPEYANNLVIDIIGEGNLKSYYQDITRLKKIWNVNFTGYLSNSELITKLKSSDFLILPSVDKGEGFGRVVVEALAVGIPVIVSEFAGISPLIAKYEVGIVYDPYDISSLRDAIKRASDMKYDPNLQCKIDSFLKNENLTLQESVRNTISIYLEALKPSQG